MRLPLLVFAALLPLAAPVHAEDTAPAPADDETDAIIVTAARTSLPVTALPLTAEVIDRARLDRQLQISGSLVDAVAALTPSFSPARQKLTGQGETLRAVRRSSRSTAFPRPRPCATDRATASPSTPSSSTGWS